jgi:hypothetical protein
MPNNKILSQVRPAPESNGCLHSSKILYRVQTVCHWSCSTLARASWAWILGSRWGGWMNIRRTRRADRKWTRREEQEVTRVRFCSCQVVDSNFEPHLLSKGASISVLHTTTDGKHRQGTRPKPTSELEVESGSVCCLLYFTQQAVLTWTVYFPGCTIDPWIKLESEQNSESTEFS